MLCGLPEVIQEVGFRAARILQELRQVRKRAEVAVFVN
jgi:hypothetical protein